MSKCITFEITKTKHDLLKTYLKTELSERDIEKIVCVGHDLILSAFEDRSKTMLFYSGKDMQEKDFPYFLPPPSRKGKGEIFLSLTIREENCNKLEDVIGLRNLGPDYILFIIEYHFSSLSQGYGLYKRQIETSVSFPFDFYNRLDNWVPQCSPVI